MPTKNAIRSFHLQLPRITSQISRNSKILVGSSGGRDFNADIARRDYSFFRNKRCRKRKVRERERERFVEPFSVKSITTSINVARDCQHSLGKKETRETSSYRLKRPLHLESFSFRLSILFSFFIPLPLFLRCTSTQ